MSPIDFSLMCRSRMSRLGMILKRLASDLVRMGMGMKMMPCSVKRVTLFPPLEAMKTECPRFFSPLASDSR
jgi:hypothetical protein